MRKRVLGSTQRPSHAADDHEWLKLQDLAQVEVTSEADGYSIETVFNFGAGPGWRAASPGIPLKEVVRQQWNFSPNGSTAESEDYAIDLKRVSILELTIYPDRGAGEALAKLADWRLA